MEKAVLKYTYELVYHLKDLKDVPKLYRDKVNEIYSHYFEDGSEFLIEMKLLVAKHLGAIFAEKRDAIRWIRGYGFDCANEDITNFLASYIKLSSDYSKWFENGQSGDEPLTYYKVYLNQETLEKGVVALNFETFNEVYDTVRNSQFEAYAWLETVRRELSEITNFEQLSTFCDNIGINIHSLI